MALPQIQEFQNQVRNGALNLSPELIRNESFTRMMNHLKIKSLEIKQVEIIEDDAKTLINISGTTILDGVKLNDLDFTLYKSESNENGFDIEWTAQISDLKLDWLIRNQFLIDQSIAEVSQLMDINFSACSWHYTSDDDNLLLSSSDAKGDLKFPELNVNFEDIGIGLSLDFKTVMKRIFELNANITIGSTSLPVSIKLPVGEFSDSVGWIVHMDGMVHLKSAFQDIQTFLSNNSFTKEAAGDHLQALIPDVFRKMDQFAIGKFYLQFDPFTATLYLLKLRIESLRTIQLFDQFKIRETGLEMMISYTRNKAHLMLHLTGGFEIGEALYAGVDVILPANPAMDWQINIDGEVELQKMEQLEAFPFLKLSDLQLPEGWLKAENITLENLRFVFNPLQGKVKSVELAMYLDASASLIPGIKVEDPYVRLNLSFE